MTTQLTNSTLAAKYYLQYIGKKGTKKQIEKLESQMTSEMILRLAKERGFESK